MTSHASRTSEPPRDGRRGRAWRPALVIGVSLCLALPACTGGAPAPAGPSAKLLVIGVDGLEWKVLRPLLAAGKCPNLRALMERGSFGKLATIDPTLSPIIWTTIGTGRMPKDHGIHDFLDENGREYTSSRRKVPALWNIADHYGLTSNVIGWWITWPAEHVRGVVVSGTSSGVLESVNWKPSLLPGAPDQVWPPELEAEVMAIAEQAGAQDKIKAIARDRIYGVIPDGVLDDAAKELEQTTLWSMQSDATFYEIGRHIMAGYPADLNLVYFGGTDVTSHRYWRQYEPDKYTWHGDPAADAALAHVVPNYYEWVDEMIGGLVAAAGPDTTVFVLSDHGFHAISLDKPPGARGMTGHHEGAQPGVLVAAGPAIVKQGGMDLFLKSGALPSLGTVADVTPTLLALLGIPFGRDMAGRPFVAMLVPGPVRDNAKLPPVDTQYPGFRAAQMDTMPEEMSASFRERFEALGYLDAPANRDAVIVSPDAPGR